MKKPTKSLALRIGTLCMLAIFCSIAIIGGISISAIKREGDLDSSRHMNLVCDDKSKSLNEFLMSVEQSVGVVAHFAAEDISSVALVKGGVIGTDGFGSYDPEGKIDTAQRRALVDYLEDHVGRVFAVLQSSANYTHGAYSFYYRLSTELSPEPLGVWYGKVNNESNYTMLSLTDLEEYAPDYYARVGWYYEPLTNGEHTWLSPYYNENLEENVLSYIVPVYKAGTFIGLVGMDIRYDTLVDRIRDVQVFETGYAYITRPDGEIIYHPTIDAGEMQDSFNPELTPVARYISGTDSTGEHTIAYTYNGAEKEMAFSTLANGMKLIVVAPSREINAGWHRLVNRIVIAGLALLMIFGLLVRYTVRRITGPLKRLTLASRHLAEGHYDVELDYNSEDEVGVLTDAFRTLTAHLQIYINDLNSRAYRDALTGVRNKGAFDIAMQKLDDQIRTQTPDQPRPDFAIAMFDCDLLKQINDDHGHDKGDLYLQNASRLVCRIFTHSPVFRIGGDEFAVVLENEDFIRREELFTVIDHACENINATAADPWDMVHISGGMAVYDPAEDENAESVLTRADALMYEDKKRRKLDVR